MDVKLPAVLEELLKTHDFQKLSEVTKCFPKSLDIFWCSGVTFPIFFLFFFKIFQKYKEKNLHFVTSERNEITSTSTTKIDYYFFVRSAFTCKSR